MTQHEKVKRKHFDETDRILLTLLQENCDQSARELTDEINRQLSDQPKPIKEGACRNRWERLKNEEYILKSCSILNPGKFNREQVCFMLVSARSWHDDALKRFIDAARSEPGVLEVHSVSGTCDYVVKIRVGNIKEAQALSKRLGADTGPIQTLIVGETHKETTAIELPPLSEIDQH